MMSYKLGDRLGGTQVPQKGTFVLAPDLSMLDAELLTLPDCRLAVSEAHQ